MSDDTETTFPSTTFAVEFNGCGAMKPDFKGDVKFSVDDLPRVLTQMHDLHCKKGALTFVSDQAQIPSGSLDREWAEMTLLDGEASELVYEKTCIGARCPVFAVHSSGEFEGRYVCEDAADAETYMEVVHGETRCPRFSASDADDDGVDELPAEDADDEVGEAELGNDQPVGAGEKPAPGPVVGVWYPDEKHARITDVGEHTLYGEFVADYLATLPVKDARKDDALDLYCVVDNESRARSLDTIVDPTQYGSSFWVEAIATAEEPAA